MTVDVLEHEIRLAGGRHTGIDEMRDSRMGQPREDIAFALESFFAGTTDQRDVEQLDRGAPFEPAVASFGEPDAAGSALADRRNQSVGADDLSCQRRNPGRAHVEHRALEKTCVVHHLMLREHGLQIGSERRIARGNGREPAVAFGWPDFKSFVQVRAEDAPPIRADGGHWRSPTPALRWQ